MDARYVDLLNKPALKVQETADLLGVNPKTVRVMLLKKLLPQIRLGRTLRIPTSAVRTMLGL